MSMWIGAMPGAMPEQLKPGDFFGQEALDTGGPSEYTIVANGSVSLWWLGRGVFKSLQAAYGSRLRGAIQQVLGQLAARPQPKLPAMQGIALLALERRREEAQLHRSLVADEFYDAKEAIAQFQVVRTIGKGQYGEVMIGFHAPTRKTYAMKRQKSSGNSPGSGTLRKRDMPHLQEPALTYIPIVFPTHRHAAA